MFFFKVGTLVSVFLAPAAFADNVTPVLSTECQLIPLAVRSGQQVNLSIFKSSSHLKDTSLPLETAVYSTTDLVEPISGLKVEFITAATVDSFKKSFYGWGTQNITTDVKGVKFHISADEFIGSEIQGDVGLPVKNLDAYVICQEFSTTHIPVK